MEQENFENKTEDMNEESGRGATRRNPFTSVTKLSKYLALALFIILPFLGGWVGYTYAPEKVVEVEKMAEGNKAILADIDFFGMATIIDQGEYRIRYDSTKIEVINDLSEVLQTISWDTSLFSSFFTATELLLITNRDINYDHYLDVGIMVNAGDGGKSRYYEFYVYDPNTKTLKREESLGTSLGTEFVSNVVNPGFDIEDRKISSCAIGPVALKEFRCWEYIFDGEKYVKGESWIETWD